MCLCGNDLSGLSASGAWEMLQAELHTEQIKTGIQNGRERRRERNKETIEFLNCGLIYSSS